MKSIAARVVSVLCERRKMYGTIIFVRFKRCNIMELIVKFQFFLIGIKIHFITMLEVAESFAFFRDEDKIFQ